MRKLCRPDAFETLVGLWGTGPRAAVTILGPVDFSGAQFMRPVHFNDVKFCGQVSASYAQFKGDLKFRGCHFDGGLDLTGADIGGSLIFEACEFGLPSRAAVGRNDTSLRLDHATVDGDVKINETSMQGFATATGAEIGGDLRFAAVHIGVQARGAPSNAVDLNHARIGGSILLDDRVTQDVGSSFGEAASGSAPQARPRSTYNRNVSAESVTVGGDLACGAALIVGDLYLRRATARSVTCAGAAVEGNFVANGLTVSEDFVVQASAAVAGGGSENTKITGTLSFYGTTARNFILTGARIGGDLEASAATCGGIFRLGERCSIGRDLDLSLATIRGQLDLEDVEGVQGIRFNGTTCGSFLIASTVGTSVACSSIEAVDSTFSSYVQFGRLSVTRKPISKPVTQPGEASDQITAGVSFQSCTFGNGLALWVPDARDANDRTNSRVTAFSEMDLEGRTRIKGSLKIVDCRITGDLDLTGVQMEDSEATDQGSDDGQIALDRTKVTGALRFCSPPSFAQRRDTRRKARDKAVKIAQEVQSGRLDRQLWQAKARRLRIVGLTATDVDLTGLWLPEPPSGSRDRRDIYAARVSVAGTFQIYDGIGSDNLSGPAIGPGALNPFAHAMVPGALNLEHSTIGELVLSKHSFTKNESGDPRTDGIVLTDATIGRLRIPQIRDADKDNGFPVPLDLEGARITSWSFDMGSDGKPPDEVGGQKADETAIANRYVDVLDNDVILHRSIYRAVSTQLRNAGQDDAASRVFFAEAYRAFWSTRGKWKRGHGRMGRVWFFLPSLQGVWDRIFRSFLRYGTSPLRLFGVIIGLFLVTLVLVAREPRNFELDDSVREVLAAGDPVGRGYATCDDGTVLGPDPAKWGWMDALWLTARYHVPVIGLAARSDFKPTNDRRIIWKIGFRKPIDVEYPLPIYWRWRHTACLPTHADAPAVGHRLPFLPDGWFNFMLVLNWVLWPILLTFLLRKVLRSE